MITITLTNDDYYALLSEAEDRRDDFRVEAKQRKSLSNASRAQLDTWNRIVQAMIDANRK